MLISTNQSNVAPTSANRFNYFADWNPADGLKASGLTSAFTMAAAQKKLKICDIQARLALSFNSRPNKSFGRNTRTWNAIETYSWNECEEGSKIVEMKNPTTNLYPFVI